MKRQTLLATILIIIISSVSAIAQPRFKKKFKYASIGINLNAMNYVGDLDPAQSFISPALRFTRLNVGATLVKRMGPRWSLRGNFAWGKIKGDDQVNSTTVGDDVFRHVRNLNFVNNIWELKADIIVDLFENRKDLRKRVNFTPYWFTGIAGFYHNPKTADGGVRLRPLGTEGQFIDGVGKDKPYSLIQAAIPLGIGFRYKIANLWDLAFEIGWRFPFTDYLDDVSTEYVDKSHFAYGSLAYQLSDRSFENPAGIAAYQAETGIAYTTTYNDGTNTHEYINTYGKDGGKRGDGNRDWYIVTGFHLTYIFHPRVICPKFR